MGSESPCKRCGKEFVIDQEDRAFYGKISVPLPTLCPLCRLRRRLMFRNERSFSKRTCDLCGKGIVALYDEHTPFPVYCVRCWWSDKWDPYAYGREFDFSRTFAENFRSLLEEVPAIAMMNDDGIGSVNCEYNADWAFSKNCYLCVCGWHAENVMYSYHCDYSKDIVDSLHVDYDELMYECVASYRCSRCRYCALCFDSQECTLCLDMKGCSNCVMCVGLRNRSYCILNEQYSKEEYEKKLDEMHLHSRTSIAKHRKMFLDFSLRSPRKFSYQLKCVHSTGNVLENCKMARDCFFARGAENSRYVAVNDIAKDSYDCTNTGKCELCYEGVTPDNTYDAVGTIFCWKCRFIYYSNNCHSSEHCFGCIALKKGSYSVLNRRYNKKEYQALRERIVSHMRETGEWGEFFPERLSPFAYNETAAHEWFPLDAREAERLSFRWKDEEKKEHDVTLPAEKLPDTIDEVDESITRETIGCAHGGSCNHKCTSAFRVTLPELQFYRRMNIPIPLLCPNCRHYERFAWRNPPILEKRTCQCAGKRSEDGAYENTMEHRHHPASGHCPNEFETSYTSDRGDIVYCEDCYQEEFA